MIEPRAIACHAILGLRWLLALLVIVVTVGGGLLCAAPAGAITSTRHTYDAAIYVYDAPAGLVSPHAEPNQSRVSPPGPSVATRRLSASARDDGVAAKTGDEFVNLASQARTTQILQGDATGGGHFWPGGAGKTSIPQSWSGRRVMHEISDVATDPASVFTPGRGGSTVVTGARDGVDIRDILRGGDIITGHPTNLPRNP